MEKCCHRPGRSLNLKSTIWSLFSLMILLTRSIAAGLGLIAPACGSGAAAVRPRAFAMVVLTLSTVALRAIVVCLLREVPSGGLTPSAKSLQYPQRIFLEDFREVKSP